MFHQIKIHWLAALLLFIMAPGVLPAPALAQVKILPQRIAKPIWFEGTFRAWYERYNDRPTIPSWFTTRLDSADFDKGECDYDQLWEAALKNPRVKPVWVETDAEWDSVRAIEPGPIYVEVFADGDVQRVASGADSSRQANSGSLGLLLETNKSFYSVNVTVVSDIDTLETVNNLILNPGASGGVESATISYQRKRLPWNGYGWGIYAAGSRSIWSYDSLSSAAFVWGLGAYLKYDAINATIGENNVGLRLQGGPGFRAIGGDVGADEYEDFRESVVGTQNKYFYGLDLSVMITFRSVTASAQSWVYFGGDADGVTGGQVRRPVQRVCSDLQQFRGAT